LLELEPSLTEYLGWAATFVFVASYFASRAEMLRRIQMVGAVMWMTYGFLIGSAPVVASNVLVLGAAAWTMARADSETYPTNRPTRVASERASEPRERPALAP
jgi:hypothetical protein